MLGSAGCLRVKTSKPSAVTAGSLAYACAVPVIVFACALVNMQTQRIRRISGRGTLYTENALLPGTRGRR